MRDKRKTEEAANGVWYYRLLHSKKLLYY